VRAILELDECEAAGPARVAIDRQHNLGRWRDRAEVRSEVCFSGRVRQITHKQPDSQSVLL
jgi:hypothetical protein